MERSEIFAVLKEIFEDVFDAGSVEPHEEMTAAEVENWDSLNNIRMIVEVEQALSIQFSTAEISNLANVGGLVTVIQKHIGS